MTGMEMPDSDLEDIDVLVVGAGNAAACAALAAREAGARVAMLETAPEDARGGNSAYTGGAYRFPFTSVDDLIRLSPDLNEMDLTKIDFGTYPKEQYFSDVAEWTEYRCDTVLTEILVDNSYDTGLWLKKNGVRFQPAFGPRRLQGRRYVPLLGRAWPATSGAAGRNC
jgi:tricarballylate dehydrogenase